MASWEKFKDEQKSLSLGLTRRQFLPLLGATAVATAAPVYCIRRKAGHLGNHPTRWRDSFT